MKEVIFKHRKINENEKRFLMKCYKHFVNQNPLSCEGEYIQHETGMYVYNDGFAANLMNGNEVIAYVKYEY